MNTIIKNLLGVALIAALLAVGVASLKYVKLYSHSIEPSSFRSFTVSDQGKVVAIPDIAQFSVSVITQNRSDVGALQKENTNKVNAVIAFLKSKNIDQKDIKTQGYDIQPQYEYTRNCEAVCPPPKIAGYTITQTISIKVREFETIGNALSGVVAAGANSVSGLSFTIDDKTELENQARAEAIKKARIKAQTLADAAGFKVGRLLGVSEGDITPYPPYGYGGDLSVVKSSANYESAPVIEPGSEEITATVSLTYEIE
jgi:uncharacterized protein YggE